MYGQIAGWAEPHPTMSEVRPHHVLESHPAHATATTPLCSWREQHPPAPPNLNVGRARNVPTPRVSFGRFLRRCWRSGSNADISTLKLGGAGGRRYTQRVAGRLFLKHRNPLEAGRPGERTTPVAPRGPADKLLASLNCRFDLGSFLFWRRCDAALPATAAATAVATAGGQGYGATHEGAGARAAGSVGFGRRLDRRAQISGRPRGRRRPPGGRTGSAEESSKRKRAGAPHHTRREAQNAQPTAPTAHI